MISVRTNKLPCRAYLNMKYQTISVVLAAVVSPVLAQVPLYGQCTFSLLMNILWPKSNFSYLGGGVTYTGPTNCASGSYCISYSDCKYFGTCRPIRRGSYMNLDYSQCIPGTGPVTSSPPVTSSRPSSTTSVTRPSTTIVSPPAGSASGVVSRSGTDFWLNGKKFCFVGCSKPKLGQ